MKYEWDVSLIQSDALCAWRRDMGEHHNKKHRKNEGPDCNQVLTRVHTYVKPIHIFYLV